MCIISININELQEKIMNSRLSYMDKLKGICIMLVVFCHYPLLSGKTIAGNVIMTLAFAAVPCFMMITGGLLCKKDRFDWKKYIKKLITLYFVIVLWRAIYISVHIVMNGNIYQYKDIISGLLFMSDVNGIDMGVFWYMKAYLITYFIYPAVWFLFRNGGRKFALCLMAVAGFSGILIPALNILMVRYVDFSIYNMIYITPFLNYPNMIFYFILGAFLLEYREYIHDKLNRIIPPLMFVAGLILLVLIKYSETGTFSWNWIYLNEGYSRVSTLIMSLGLYLCFDFYCSSKEGVFGKVVGQSTMGIYYMHYIMLVACNKYLYSYIGIEYYSVMANIIKTIVITFVCVILTMIIKKIPVLKKMVM